MSECGVAWCICLILKLHKHRAAPEILPSNQQQLYRSAYTITLKYIMALWEKRWVELRLWRYFFRWFCVSVCVLVNVLVYMNSVPSMIGMRKQTTPLPSQFTISNRIRKRAHWIVACLRKRERTHALWIANKSYAMCIKKSLKRDFPLVWIALCLRVFSNVWAQAHAYCNINTTTATIISLLLSLQIDNNVRVFAWIQKAVWGNDK